MFESCPQSFSVWLRSGRSVIRCIWARSTSGVQTPGRLAIPLLLLTQQLKLSSGSHAKALLFSISPQLRGSTCCIPCYLFFRSSDKEKKKTLRYKKKNFFFFLVFFLFSPT